MVPVAPNKKTHWGEVGELGLAGAGCMADVVVEKPNQNHGGFPFQGALERFVLFSVIV
jgi:hypothetical protein